MTQLSTDQDEFLIRVVYKVTGHVEEFWVSDFSIELTNSGGYKATWAAVENKRPIMLNIDEVASIWQIAVRKARK